jgi:hypothetical protein
MICFLDILEPRVLEPNQLVMTENQEVIEQYYIIKGSTQVGFEINKPSSPREDYSP